MKIGTFEATVLVNGKPVREYSHEDSWYIEGRKGSEFELKFHNRSSKRVLVVPAVDGLSVMDGQPASEKSRGYIVSGYGTLTIPGWRLDDSSIAKFIFKDRKQSYAEATEAGSGNAGVIGFLVFEEAEAVIQTIHHYWPPNHTWIAPRWWETYPYYPTDRLYSTCDTLMASGTVTATAAVAKSSATRTSAAGPVRHMAATGSIMPQNTGEATAAVFSQDGGMNGAGREMLLETTSDSLQADDDAEGSFSLGTGFGDQANHAVTRVDFKRKSETPAATLVLYYDSRRNLEKKGIQVVAEHGEVASAPNPFPAMAAGCTPPAGWTPKGN